MSVVKSVTSVKRYWPPSFVDELETRMSTLIICAR